MRKRDKNRLKLLLAAGLIFVVAMQMGYLAGFGIKPITFSGIVPIGEGIDVYAKVNTKNSISLATCDLIVNMYDSSGKFIDTVTTSSGVATYGVMVKAGQHVWLQARQAAPATTTYYISPLTEFVVPLAAEAADTVSLGTLYVNQVTTSNPTMVIRNGFQNDTISDGSTHFLNTTDTSATITIVNSVANTYYGGNTFVDKITGKQYLAGVWILWKGTVNQPWDIAPDYAAFDATNSWYLWNINSLPYDSNGDVNLRTGVVQISVGSDTFSDDATVVIDAFDTFCITDWLAGSYSAALIDGHSVGVTAITTKVA